MAAETATKAALIHGLKTVDVMVKGPGSGREAAIRTRKLSYLLSLTLCWIFYHIQGNLALNQVIYIFSEQELYLLPSSSFPPN